MEIVLDDLVEGMLKAACSDKALGEAMNLASGEEIRVIDLAHMINEAMSNKAGIKYVQRRKWDTKSRLLASIDRAKDLIGYEPKMRFEEGLSRTIDRFRYRWDLIDKSAKSGPGISSAVRDFLQNS